MTEAGVRRLALVALVALLAGCGGGGEGRTTLRFWGMGREGEVVQGLIRDFERENPDLRVEVQQIPWSAAHEKLLTSIVGRSTPDVAQLGNTWIAEFSALRALLPLDARIAASAGMDSSAYFHGIWDTNVVGERVYGVPWYVDTRVLFYRKDIFARAGYDAVPETWDGWRASLEAVKREVGSERYAIFLPTNEWNVPVILGLQAGSPLLVDDDTRGAFSQPAFRRAFRFYLDLFREKLAPPVTGNEIANMYQEFAREYFSMLVTGPWNLGEFARRLPADLQDDWGTAPFPGPEGPASGVSLAGGSSLVVFRNTNHPDAAWRLVEFLSRPETQVRFYGLTGDLPARREAWEDTALTGDPNLAAFRVQLERTVSTPKVPEWELIASRLQEQAEAAVRGVVAPDSALAKLDREVNRILEKRRWLLEHGRLRAWESAEAGR
jgi:multiple sugar transport system substrate-binding protein